MFDKLLLLSQDVPEGGDGFRWKAHPYLRMAGALPKGPAVFEWSARQRADLEALWRDPTADGARERLARDLAAFCGKLGWAPDGKLLETAEQQGSDFLLTMSAVPPELYVLPWEVIEVGAAGTYLSDFASAQVRYAMPGLESRPIQAAPPLPGVLFAWSAAGGEVPHEEHAAALRAAAEAGGVVFRELADVDEAKLRAALEAGPPSVLHLLCHGVPGPEGEPSRLSWGASDSPVEITATRLARMLRPHDGALRLVVLSACGGGDGQGDPMFMTSLAQEIHKKGIPSVVASRYPLSARGSRVMTRALYDKLLREAWSLERALRHTRQTLFQPDADGESYPGDAYGIQLYAHDTECFVSDNQVQAERPVLASYPFGTPARPVPARPPPAAELTLDMKSEPGVSEDELLDRLRRVSEDENLTVAIPLGKDKGKKKCALLVHTTVDGAHRLLGAWKSKVLQVAVGVVLGELVITKGMPVLKSLLASAVGKLGGAAGAVGGAGGNLLGAAGQVGGAAGQLGGAAGQVGGVAGQVGGAAGQVGGAAGQVGGAAGQVGGAAGQVGGAAGQVGASKLGAAAGKIGVAAARAKRITHTVGRASRASKGAIGKAGSAAGKVGTTAGQAGQAGAAAGQAGAAAGQAGAAAGQVATGTIGKIATSAVSIATKAVSAKLAVVAVASTVAVAGGATVYRMETRSREPVASESRHDASLAVAVGRSARAASPARGAGGGAPGDPEAAKIVESGAVPGGPSTAPMGAGLSAGAGGTSEAAAVAATVAARAAGAHSGAGGDGRGAAGAGAPSGGGGAVTTAGSGISGAPSQGGGDPAIASAVGGGGAAVASGGAASAAGDGAAPTSGGIGTTGASEAAGAPAGGAVATTAAAPGTGGVALAGDGVAPTPGAPGVGDARPSNGGIDGAPSAAAAGGTANPQAPTTLSAPLGGSPRSAAAGAGSPPAAGPLSDTLAAQPPGEDAAESPAKPAAGAASEAPAHALAVCGDGRPEAGEECDDGNTRDGDGCTSSCRRELKQVTVEPSRMDRLRISGTMNLPPLSKPTKAAMQRDGVTSLRGTVKLCIDTSGMVSDSMLVERSGYAEYDSKLLSIVHEWRFRPYLLNGAPVPVCSTQEFVYVPAK